MAKFESSHLEALASFASAYRQCEAWLPPVDLLSLADYGDILSKDEMGLLHNSGSASSQVVSLPITLLAQAKILHYFTATYRMRAEAAESQLEFHRREAILLKQRHSEATLNNSYSQEKAWNADLKAQEMQDEIESLKEKNASLQKEIHLATCKLKQAKESIAKLEQREESLSCQLDQALSTYTRDTTELRKTVMLLREELLSQGPESQSEREHGTCLTPTSSTDTFGINIKHNRNNTGTISIRHNSSWLDTTLRDISFELSETGLCEAAQPVSPSDTKAECPKHFTRKPFQHQRSLSSNAKIPHSISSNPTDKYERRRTSSSSTPIQLVFQRPHHIRSRLGCGEHTEKMKVLEVENSDNIQNLANQLKAISDQMLLENLSQSPIESSSTAINSPLPPESSNLLENTSQKRGLDSCDSPSLKQRPLSIPLTPIGESPMPPSAPQSRHRRGEAITEVPACDTDLAVQRAMEGEFVYKSSRTLLGQEKRHLRFMWINPQSNALYWCSVNPGTQRSLYMDRTYQGARSAIICGIRLVSDPWSPSENYVACFSHGMPNSNLNISSSQLSVADDGKKAKWTAHHNKLPVLSIIIQLTGREIKIKARNLASHKAWEAALMYLQPNWPPSLPSSVSSKDLVTPKSSIFPLRNIDPRKAPCRNRRTRIQYLTTTPISSPTVE
ncbi:hypothetical protein DSO57_1028189 [Entomophthora muscae]|uniref:Uncharacterized protein n=1 Tax=Entomophthora muscae TaxID=34485 RepID=A0ACC2S3B4_9FUNG|nr:hypothetical protein DSO57_1028189 [Entomophthora muscae]